MTNENSSVDCYIVVKDLSKMTETIIQKEGSSIPLGRRGENGIKQISFNIGAWKRNLGDGKVYLVVRRQGEKESYKVNLDVKEDSAVWNVSRIDTSIEGMGVVQLTYVVDEQVAKTAVYSTYVESGIGEGYIVPATAYEIAVSHGFQGTEEEWLESLKGSGEGQGTKGEKGEPGSSAYDIAVKNGYHGTEQEWIASLKGKDGKDGQPGAKGADGKNGEPGQKGEQGAKGEPGQKGADGKNGEKGENGTPGVPGKNGESAYELWKRQSGNSQKSEQQFLESLKGQKGDTGQKGADGAPGKNGANGVKGADGATIDKITLNKSGDGQITGGTAHLTNGSSVNITVEQK